jgi:hypothetical protein
MRERLRALRMKAALPGLNIALPMLAFWVVYQALVGRPAPFWLLMLAAIAHGIKLGIEEAYRAGMRQEGDK